MILKSIPILFIFCLLIFTDVLAQTTRDSDTKKEAPSNIETVKKKKKANKNGYKYKMDNAIKEYEELQKTNAKKKSKMQKDMQKPQYSDPTYFGHKKKPKKRSLKKRKMCKECGIVH